MFLSKGVADQPLQILAAYKIRSPSKCSSTSVCLEMIAKRGHPQKSCMDFFGKIRLFILQMVTETAMNQSMENR